MQRMAEMCAILRRWPRDVLPDHRVLARESVQQCREMFEASRIVLAFEHGDEPWTTVAALDEDGFTWREEGSFDVAASVAAELSDLTFYTGSAKRDRATVRIACGEGTVEIKTPLHPVLRRQIGPDPVLSTPVVSENLAGRLFVCSPAEPSDMELVIAEAVGVIIAARF